MPLAVRAAGRRKAAAEIMPAPWRRAGGDFTGVSGNPCDCGRERCELTILGPGGSSGGVRKDELLVLDSEGDSEGEDGPSTIFGGGNCARCTGEEEVDAPSGDGDGGPFVGEGRSEEIRGTVGDPGTRPRARAKGEAGETESTLARGEVCIAGGVIGVAGAKG